MDNLDFTINPKDYIHIQKIAIGPFITSSFIFILIILLVIYFFHKKYKISKHIFTFLSTMFFYILSYDIYLNSFEQSQKILWINITYTAVLLNSLGIIYYFYFIANRKDFVPKLTPFILTIIIILIIWLNNPLFIKILFNKLQLSIIFKLYTSFVSIYLLGIYVFNVLIFLNYIRTNSQEKEIVYILFIISVFWIIYIFYIIIIFKSLDQTTTIWIPFLFETICMAICFVLSIKNEKKELKKIILEKDVLYQKIIRDQLTNVYGRSYLFEILQNEITTLNHKKQQLSLIFIDIDNFKKINDNFGHTVGDKVLEGLGNILINNIKEPDIPSRYAGDEFVLLLYKKSQAETLTIANKIIDDYNNLIKQYSIDYIVDTGLSFGINTSINWSKDAIEVIKNADKAMYISKQKGPNNIEFHHRI